MDAVKASIPNTECYIRVKDKLWMHNEIRKQNYTHQAQNTPICQTN